MSSAASVAAVAAAAVALAAAAAAAAAAVAAAVLAMVVTVAVAAAAPDLLCGLMFPPRGPPRRHWAPCSSREAPLRQLAALLPCVLACEHLDPRSRRKARPSASYRRRARRPREESCSLSSASVMRPTVVTRRATVCLHSTTPIAEKGKRKSSPNCDILGHALQSMLFLNSQEVSAPFTKKKKKPFLHPLR